MKKAKKKKMSKTAGKLVNLLAETATNVQVNTMQTQILLAAVVAARTAARTVNRLGALEEGIHAVRMILPRCWFDAEKCAVGLEALQNYRREYNSRLSEFRETPVADWSTHGSDAFRMAAVSCDNAFDIGYFADGRWHGKVPGKSRHYQPDTSWIY